MFDYLYKQKKEFQHTAARRRLREKLSAEELKEIVSTHSRPKAAASTFLVNAY